MNGVMYFNDGEGSFDLIDLNQKQVVESWGIALKPVAPTHAHASTIGDYNNDGVDALAASCCVCKAADGVHRGHKQEQRCL